MPACMTGRTMYVIPYSHGRHRLAVCQGTALRSPTPSMLSLNMAIMTRVGTKVSEALGDSRRLCQAASTPRPSSTRRSATSSTSRRTTPSWSVNSGYGGNVLLGKKCFALRIASYLGRKEGWMAEHMLILGIENPQGRDPATSAAAFPSACGKTNLAMLIPPAVVA